ncbi:ComF family protein [Aureivirga sp. CE67]|uniref:ComF family protein n=1 Tax=Aureivirga sp. CE67 TaxID=1788983 RepID=UPI0018CAD4D2|nr:phosphoribosyltransferase family protein [Aureivirga sp. CE67]
MKIVTPILDLFYPQYCLGCFEEVADDNFNICLDCRTNLPITNFSIIENNDLKRKFQGRLNIKHATSLYYFNKKNKIQNLVHVLKYRNKQKIGEFFGEILGEEILQSDYFTSIDYVIPIPLHPQKFRKRGYNQNTLFGKTIAKKINAAFCEENVQRIKKTESQTRKSKDERFHNTENIFKINDLEKYEGKHILLIDDIITTGATIESCAKELLKVKNLEISIASIAFTH